jgi:cytochrome c-type biogenesis protein CcmF
VRWIWGGGLFMMLGGFVSAADRRFRVKHAAGAAQPQGVSTTLRGSQA